MAAIRGSGSESVAEFNIRLGRKLEASIGMNLKRWKLVKTTLLSLAVLLFGGFAIDAGADATVVGLGALVIAGAIASIEMIELSWANGLDITVESGNDEG